MKKRIISICLVVALAAIAAAGSLAYFNDKGAERNTFTVGEIDIDLFEMVDDKKQTAGFEYTEPMMPSMAFSKEVHVTVAEDSQPCWVFVDMTFNKKDTLLPLMAQVALEKEQLTGATLADWQTEDKFVAVEFLSDMFVNYNDAIHTVFTDWFVGIDANKWQLFDISVTNSADTVTLRYARNAVLAPEADEIFMTKFQMPEQVTREMLSNKLAGAEPFQSENTPFTIEYKAYAIQATGLDTVDAAYAALFNVPLA